LTSCFSHAVAIAEGKFLPALSPTKKKKIPGGGEIDVPIVLSPSEDPSAGEIDPEIDDKDTEEEIDALAREVRRQDPTYQIPTLDNLWHHYCSKFADSLQRYVVIACGDTG
jgi:hypothetical protein